MGWLMRAAVILMAVGSLTSRANAEPLVLISVLEDDFMVVDLGTINKQAAFPKVWVYARFGQPKAVNGKRIVLTKWLVEVDCRNRETRATHIAWEDVQKAKGSEPLSVPFSPIIPGDSYNALYRLVCGSGVTEKDSVFASMEHLIDVQTKWSRLSPEERSAH